MRTPTLAAAGFLGLALLTVARAPASGSRTVTISPDAQLRSKLHGLVTAQEKFWADHGTYTTDVSLLSMFRPKPSPSDSVWVQVLFAGGRSWSGRALYRGGLDKSCVVYIDALNDFPSSPVTEGDSVRATEEGSPVCDKF